MPVAPTFWKVTDVRLLQGPAARRAIPRRPSISRRPCEQSCKLPPQKQLRRIVLIQPADLQPKEFRQDPRGVTDFFPATVRRTTISSLAHRLADRESAKEQESSCRDGADRPTTEAGCRDPCSVAGAVSASAARRSSVLPGSSHVHNAAEECRATWFVGSSRRPSPSLSCLPPGRSGPLISRHVDRHHPVFQSG